MDNAFRNSHLVAYDDPFAVPTLANFLIDSNWLESLEEDRSSQEQAETQAWLSRRRLVGELWRAALSSGPFHAEKAKAEEEWTGDPLSYWIGYGNMPPTSLPRADLTESFTPEQKLTLEKARVHQQDGDDVSEFQYQDTLLINDREPRNADICGVGLPDSSTCAPLSTCSIGC